MRFLEIENQKSLKSLMQELKVDPWGVKIMVPKGVSHLIRVNSVSNIAANIIKQEMLSIGGDAAVARGALTGSKKKTDCLIIGSLAQIKCLHKKLQHQPFGLSRLAGELSDSLANYSRERFVLDLGRFKLTLGCKAQVMGIINLTPDSFSGDGLYDSARVDIVEVAEGLVSDGADILDIGGESSRPGAKPVSLKEELSRVIPVIKILAKKIKVPISIDTSKPEVARQALDNGAVIVNDITGLRSPKMRRVVSGFDSAVVAMHMKGVPRTMQQNVKYHSLIDQVMDFFKKSLSRAIEDGVDRDKIILDPGIGFGKSPEDNLRILRHLKEFKVLGRPILVGVSRKSFIGKVLGVAVDQRLSGTIASCVLAADNGAKILRVHDVKQVKEAMKVLNAMNKTSYNGK